MNGIRVEDLGLSAGALRELDRRASYRGETRQQMFDLFRRGRASALKEFGVDPEDADLAAKDPEDLRQWMEKLFQEMSELGHLAQDIGYLREGSRRPGQTASPKAMRAAMDAILSKKLDESGHVSKPGFRGFIAAELINSNGLAELSIRWTEDYLSSLEEGWEKLNGENVALDLALERFRECQQKIVEGTTNLGYLTRLAQVAKHALSDNDDMEAARTTSLLDVFSDFIQSRQDFGGKSRLSPMRRSMALRLVGIAARNYGTMMAWGGRWARSGFPTVKICAELAASLAMTDIPDDFINSEVRLPWKAFRLDIPSGLLEDEGGEAAHMMVFQMEGDGDTEWWSSTLMSDGRFLSSQKKHQSMADLARGDGDNLSILCGRLLVGVCLSVTGGARLRRRSNKAKKNAGVRPSDSPEQEYVLGEDIHVSLDLREHVRSMARGHMLLTGVRRLVRGHWRNQPYGPGRSMRRRQWIEPFWRGEEGAPTLVRDHIIEGPITSDPSWPGS